jgi:HD-like signal output (HDOD) protein
MAVPHSPITPELIVHGLGALPAAPAVIPQLIKILTDQNRPSDEAIELIKVDQGLVAQVLHVANSAFYAARQRVTSVEQAISIVGFVRAYELVAYAATQGVLLRTLDTYGLTADDMWRLSVGGAIASDCLAMRVGADPSTAYTIGLLHGVGLVAIDLWSARHGAHLRIAWHREGAVTAAAEDRALGCDHPAVGAQLLRKWGFPAEFTEPMRRQFHPPVSGRYALGTALLHAALWVRDVAHWPADEPPPGPPHQAVLATLGLAPGDLLELVPEVQARFERAKALLIDGPLDDA